MIELVEEIGNLKYDSLSQFIDMLSNKIQNDGVKDESKGRIKLSKNLFQCSKNLKESVKYIDRAWKICEPYTK